MIGKGSFRRLLRNLRRRKEAQEANPDQSIRAMIDGKWQDCVVVGIRGLCLVVASEGGQSVVQATNAMNAEDYWKLWNSLGGNAMKLCWEDGTPFEPGGK